LTEKSRVGLLTKIWNITIVFISNMETVWILWLQWRTLSLFLEPHSCNGHKGSINWIGYLLHQFPNTRNTMCGFLCCHCNCWCYNQSHNKFLAHNSECISCHLPDEIEKFFTVNIPIKVDITFLQIVIWISHLLPTNY